jgi:hypothetical protein
MVIINDLFIIFIHNDHSTPAEATSDLCAKWDAAWVIPGEVLLMADPVPWMVGPCWARGGLGKLWDTRT